MNLFEATSCTMGASWGDIGTSLTGIIGNSVDGYKKVVNLYVTNTTSSTITLNVIHSAGLSGSGVITSGLAVPPNSTINIVTKETPVYLWGIYNSLSASASATGIRYTVYFEDYE